MFSRRYVDHKPHFEDDMILKDAHIPTWLDLLLLGSILHVPKTGARLEGPVGAQGDERNPIQIP